MRSTKTIKDLVMGGESADQTAKSPDCRPCVQRSSQGRGSEVYQRTLAQPHRLASGGTQCNYTTRIMQNVSDSKAFFKRKIDFLTKQIEKIQPALQEKHAMKQAVLEVMNVKIQQLQQSGQAFSTKA
ncbi:uncharacterized protein LOC129186716 isoform X4 [Dunckerocampus dactyliophorus]|uniref:uncharacterized protein LOC129186716 isoform X4 n=1 Tax=Dunckerocampus dactyliophorus TaxID=161453 RepID=UPI0024065A74|nr:uncharacterized protein LOC129186716 isoform X4 [Dunckerocampus dactyliophorus]